MGGWGGAWEWGWRGWDGWGGVRCVFDRGDGGVRAAQHRGWCWWWAGRGLGQWREGGDPRDSASVHDQRRWRRTVRRAEAAPPVCLQSLAGTQHCRRRCIARRQRAVLPGQTAWPPGFLCPCPAPELPPAYTLPEAQEDGAKLRDTARDSRGARQQGPPRLVISLRAAGPSRVRGIS